MYAVWDEKELQKCRRIDGYTLRETLKEIGKGRSCNEEDMVVAQMLFLLSEDVFDLIAEFLKDRFLNRHAENDTLVWGTHVVSLTGKKAGAEFANDFRPAALFPVIYKWYSRVLLALTIEKIQYLSVYQFAFRKKYQAGEALYILRPLIEKVERVANFSPRPRFHS